MATQGLILCSSYQRFSSSSFLSECSHSGALVSDPINHRAFSVPT